MKILLYRPDSQHGAYRIFYNVDKYSLNPDNTITITDNRKSTKYKMERIMDATWSDETKYGPREFVVKLEATPIEDDIYA